MVRSTWKIGSRPRIAHRLCARRPSHAEIDPAEADHDRRQQLHGAHADIAAGGVEAERPALHAVGIKERDVGHARGKVAATQAGGCSDQQHDAERGGRPRHEVGEQRGRDEEQYRAHHRPVAPAENRHREGIRKAHQRADQARQRHELEQLVGRVVKACRRQLGRDDAPDLPDREAYILGDDRPDQVAPSDRLALRFPVVRIFRIPVGNPARAVFAHHEVPLLLFACRSASPAGRLAFGKILAAGATGSPWPPGGRRSASGHAMLISPAAAR